MLNTAAMRTSQTHLNIFLATIWQDPSKVLIPAQFQPFMNSFVFKRKCTYTINDRVFNEGKMKNMELDFVIIELICNSVK